MSPDTSDLLLRAPSVEVVDAGNCNIGSASSLLLLIVLEIDGGADGEIMRVNERGME